MHALCFRCRFLLATEFVASNFWIWPCRGSTDFHYHTTNSLSLPLTLPLSHSPPTCRQCTNLPWLSYNFNNYFRFRSDAANVLQIPVNMSFKVRYTHNLTNFVACSQAIATKLDNCLHGLLKQKLFLSILPIWRIEELHLQSQKWSVKTYNTSIAINALRFCNIHLCNWPLSTRESLKGWKVHSLSVNYI